MKKNKFAKLPCLNNVKLFFILLYFKYKIFEKVAEAESGNFSFSKTQFRSKFRCNSMKNPHTIRISSYYLIFSHIVSNFLIISRISSYCLEFLIISRIYSYCLNFLILSRISSYCLEFPHTV